MVSYVPILVRVLVLDVTLTAEMNCVRNVTFRRINFTRPLKAIYIKTELDSNPDEDADSPSYDAKSGFIDGILVGQCRLNR
jgi:hypothetical protein